MADDTPFMGSLTKEDLDLAREVGIDTSKYTPESALTREGYRPVEQADYETSWSDYYKTLKSGGAGVVSGLAGGAEYLTGGALGGDTRRYFNEISDEQIKAMSPAGRRAGPQAEFLPEEGGVSVFDNFASSLGLKLTSALPSLVASIIPAGIAVKALQGASLGARVLGAGVATRGTAGLMAGGDVAGQIYSEVEKLSDKDLQAKSELYAGYRSMMPEADARRQFMQEVAGAAPAAAALISAAIGGAEGQVAGRLAGKAATGVLRGIRSGAAHEAAQETAESGVGELLAQLALTDQNLAQMNWQKILSKGLEGATIGGIMGGGVGGISGIGGRADAGTLTGTSDPDAIKKLMEAEQAPETESQGVVPPKGYGTGTAPAPAEDPTAGNPQSQPSGSERQYPKGKAPPFTIDTVRSRLEAKGIEFPEDRLQEIEGRISEIRKMKAGKRGAEYGALLKSLYPAETTVVAQTIAPGLQVGEGLDPAQLAAVQAANPVQPVQAPPSVMAPATPPPVADALGNLTTPRAPAPAPEPPAPAPAPAPIPPPVAAAVQKQTAAPAQSEVQPISDNSGGWNYIKFGNAQVELQKDGIGWKPTDGQSTIFYATGKGPGTRRRGEAHLSGMAKAGVPAEVMPIFTDYANGKIDKDQVLEQLRGLEAKFKQRQAAAPKAPVDTGTNLQQPAADLLAEQEELISGQRAVQMFPTNTTPLKLPKGMKKSKTSRGVFHYNPDAMLPNGSKVTEGLIQRLSAMGKENELLGLGDRTKQDVADNASKEGGVTTVNEVTPAGDTVKSVASTVADADRQAQMLSENAAPENKVEIKPTEQALGPRVLRDVSEAGQAADAAQAEADAAAAARVAEEQKAKQAKAASEARAETVEGKVGTEAMLTKDQQRSAKVSEDEKAAAEVVADHMPTEAEANLNSKNGAERQAAMQAMYNRLQNMVKAAGQRGIKIPERVRKQADDLVLLASAKKFLDARAPAAAKGGLGTVKPYQEFVAAETSLRGGREAAAAERARAKAEMETAAAKFAPAEEEKATVGEESGMLSQSAEEMAMTPEERMIASQEDDAENFNRSKEEVEEVFAQGRDRPSAIKSKAEEVLAKVRERKKKAEELAERGATEGERQAAAAAVERIAKSEETVAEKAQEIALAQFVTAGQDKTGKFKVGRGNKDLRPTVVGKVSLKPKAAAAVAQPKSVYETGRAFVANVYHGTTRAYGRMSAEFLGTNTKAPSAEQAFFFTDTPSMSNVFAGVPDQRANVSTEEILEYAKNGPSATTPNLRTQLQTLTDDQADRLTKLVGVISKVNNPESVADKIRNLFRESDPLAAQRDMARLRMEDPNYDYAGSTPRTVLSRIELTNPLVVDFEGARSRPSSFATTIENAKRDGHDGVVLKNVWDGGELGNVFAVFDENQISDRFQPQAKAEPTTARTRNYDVPVSEIEKLSGPDFSPIARYIATLKAWQAKLSDADWQQLADWKMYDFPRVLSGPMEPARLLAAFDLSLKEGKQVFLQSGESDPRTGNYTDVAERIASELQLATPTRASMPTGQRARARVSAPPAGPTVRMAGVDFTPIQSTNVSRSMKMVSDDFYKMFRGGPDRLFATFFRNKLTQRVGDVPVHIVTPEDIQNIYFKATGKVGVPDGIYRNGVIALNVNTVADPVSGLEVAMHEALHAWSENAINSSPGLQRALDIMVARGLSEHRLIQDLEGQGTDRSSPYGLTDRYEFISEAFSSPDFRSFLSSVELSKADRMLIEREIGPVKGPFKTALDAFLQLLRSAMGLPDTLGNYTLLDAVMRAGAKIDAIVEQQGAGLDISAPARASIAGDTLNSAGDMQRWLVGKAKRGAAMFGNNRNLAQQYANTVIGPGLQQIVDAVSATLPRVKEIKEAGSKLATRTIELSSKYPEQFRKLAEIMESARMMSVSIEGENFFVKNPNTDATKYWQAKAQFKDLQAQFASIQHEELKQLYRDMAAFYRTTHNDLVQAKVTSILENLGLRQARGKAKGSALTDAQIADLTQRVMNQEMTPADKTLLGTAMYNSLKNAADFHRVEGDYFPLMRYGDYVVTTSDKIKDTMGGKLEKPDTVLFRNKSNTVARRAAEAFVGKSELRQLSVEKVYFDNVSGKELQNEDEAKSYNDVDIGYRVTMQTKGVEFFESGRAAEEFARTNPEGYDTISNPEIRMGSGYQAQVMTGTQVSSMNSAIDARVESGNITEGQGALLKSIVNEAATRMLSGNRIASRRLKAKKVMGASRDIARNLEQYNASAAREIATSENMPLIRDGLDKISKAITGYAGNDRAQLVAVVDEVKARVDQGIVAPNEPNKYMKDLMSVVFLARLFSPAYTVINGTQPWTVTAPVLSGKFGVRRTFAALTDAYKDIGFGNAALQGMMNTVRAAKGMNSPALLDTRDIFGDMRTKISKTGDGAAVVKMLDELVRLGAIDKDAGLEVSATATEGRGWLPKTIAGVDRIARQLPQMMEAVNRTVAATAAYRLAIQNGQTPEQATRYALDTVTNTQGDYSAANAPRFFNNPILRPALMFKKYAQMMTYLLGDMAYRAFKGATPEERMVALKQLGYILGVQVLVAGALSLPGLEIIKAGFLIASMLGVGGGWDEVEEKLRKALDEAVGKPFGQMISSGVLTRLGGYGIDVSQRMSLADMWLFGEPKSDTSEGTQAYLFRQTVGAPGGYVMDVIEGLRLMVHEGEYAKGLGKVLPAKFAADTAKALHGKSESAYERDADKKTVSGYGEVAANIFGFKTARQAEVSRRTGSSIRDRKDMEKEQKKLANAYFNARTKGDQMKAIARNIEFNATLETPAQKRRFALPIKPRELRTAQ